MCERHIRVEGNHECGLVRNDDYDLYNWLVKRFDPVEKAVPNYQHWRVDRHPIIEIKPGWRTDANVGCIDTCDYYFTY